MLEYSVSPLGVKYSLSHAGSVCYFRGLVIHCNSLRTTAAGRDKEGEFSTTSLEFEYLHRRTRCEMLIGKDEISNDVITPGTCFSMFAYIRADWRKSDSSVEGKPQGNWRWNSNSRDVVVCSPSFPTPPPQSPGELAPRLSYNFATGIPVLFGYGSSTERLRTIYGWVKWDWHKKNS